VLTGATGRRGRWLRALLLLLGAGVVLVLVREAGLAVVWDAVTTIGWRLVIVILVPYGLSTTLHTVGWRLTFPRRSPPFVALWRARVIGEAVNVSTPTASVGGEPVKALLVRAWAPLVDGFASVVLDKTTVVIGQGLFLLAGLVLATWLIPASSPLLSVMAVLLLVETLAVAGFVAVQLGGMAGRGGRLLTRFGVGPGAEHQARLEGLDEAIGEAYRRQPERLAQSACWHFAAWVCGGLELYLILTFLHMPVPFTTALVLEAFGAAVRFASFVVPASLGALEGGNMAIFAALGFPGSLGLSSTLIRRLREAAWAIGGLVAFAAQTARPEPTSGERGG
jgi:putative membrane protein